MGRGAGCEGAPVSLVLTRDQAVPVLRTILVAPVTRTIRGIPTEVPVGVEEGLPADGVAAMDNVLAFPKALLVRRMGALSPERRPRALRGPSRRHRLLIWVIRRWGG